MAVPIWKDKYVSLGSTDGTLFRVLQGSTVIYQGKGMKRPGDSAVKVRINDICADWMQYAASSLSLAAFEGLSFPLSFTIKKSTDGSTWSDVETVSFYNDWSYDASYVATTSGMAFPVTGRIDIRQWIPWTAPSTPGSTISVAVFYKSGSSTTITKSAVSDPSGSPAANDGPFYRALFSAGFRTVLFSISSLINTVDHITVGGVRYDVTYGCADYVLYYRNLYGGIDSLLIEGAAIPGDSMTVWERKVQYDNGTADARGIQNYVNEVERTYTLHTGPLDSIASLRMKHVLTSSELFLCEISTGNTVPVILTGTANEYKTVAQNGQQMVDYAIGVKVAQQFERR